QHTDDAALHDRRAACLARAQTEFAAIVDRLAEMDRAHVAQSQRLVDSLPDLVPCARAKVDDDFATDPARRAKLATYLDELAQASSLIAVGRFEDARAHVAAVTIAAREL